MDQVSSLRSITTGGPDDPFLPHLLEAIFYADEIELAVAFTKITGLRLIFDALAEALERGKSLKVLTTDYLNVTDPEVLLQLMLLSELRADVRIFESAGESFHLKAYIII